MVAHACVDGDPAPEWSVDALPRTQLRAIVHNAGGVAADQVSSKKQKIGVMPEHLDRKRPGGFAIDSFESGFTASECTRPAIAGENEGEFRLLRGGLKGILSGDERIFSVLVDNRALDLILIAPCWQHPFDGDHVAGSRSAARD